LTNNIVTCRHFITCIFIKGLFFFRVKEVFLIIRCEQCNTTYHLDESLIEPFGSKVRCTRCGHIFWAETTIFTNRLSEPESISELEPSSVLEAEEATRPLARPAGPTKKTLMILGVILLLVLLAPAARYFYVQYNHPNWDYTDIWAKVFFFPVDPEGNQKISLLNIRKSFKENPKIGRFFIIEGVIKNGYPETRQRIKIRGSLRSGENKVASTREVYAGWTFTNGELETLSIEEINKLILSQPDRFSPNIRVLPGKTLPFTIFFPPLPPGSNQVSIEVIGSQKAQPISKP
jgi:predicted Zn finger-like uncharacterized protein